MTLDATLESVLFAAARPLTVKQLAEIAQADAPAITSALETLRMRLDTMERGIMLQTDGHAHELVTRPEAREAVTRIVQGETQGELTRPSLEALTILAYCGPMTRAELEHIRGVHSSLILRNLLLRGLVEQKEDEKFGQPTYSVTFDFLNHLGIQNVTSLPSYAEMRARAPTSDIDELSQPLAI